MAHDRAILLRKAGEVERRAASTVEMGGHAEQRADRDDTGAPDTGNENVEGLFQFLPRRQRKIGEQLAFAFGFLGGHVQAEVPLRQR